MAKSHFGRGRASALMGFPIGPGPALPHGIPVSNANGYDQNLALSGQLLAQLKAARRQPVAPAAAPVARPAQPSPQDLYNSQAGARAAAAQALQSMQLRADEQKAAHQAQLDLEDRKFAHQQALAGGTKADLLSTKINADAEKNATVEAGRNSRAADRMTFDQKQRDVVNQIAQGKLSVEQGRAQLQQNEAAFNQQHQNAVLAERGANDGVAVKPVAPTVNPANNGANTLGPSPKVAPVQGAPGPTGATGAVSPVQQLDRNAQGDFPAQGSATVAPAEGGPLVPKAIRNERARVAEKGNENDAAVQAALGHIMAEADRLPSTQAKADFLNRKLSVLNDALLPGDKTNPLIASQLPDITKPGGFRSLGGLGPRYTFEQEVQQGSPQWKSLIAGERQGLLHEANNQQDALARAVAAKRDELTADPNNPALLAKLPDADAANEAIRNYKQYQLDQKQRATQSAAAEAAANAPGAFRRAFQPIEDTAAGIANTALHPVDTAGNFLKSRYDAVRHPVDTFQKTGTSPILDPTGAGAQTQDVINTAQQGNLAGATSKAALLAAQAYLGTKAGAPGPQVEGNVANTVQGAKNVVNNLGQTGVDVGQGLINTGDKMGRGGFLTKIPGALIETISKQLRFGEPITAAQEAELRAAGLDADTISYIKRSGVMPEKPVSRGSQPRDLGPLDVQQPVAPGRSTLAQEAGPYEPRPAADTTLGDVAPTQVTGQYMPKSAKPTVPPEPPVKPGDTSALPFEPVSSVEEAAGQQLGKFTPEQMADFQKLSKATGLPVEEIAKRASAPPVSKMPDGTARVAPAADPSAPPVEPPKGVTRYKPPYERWPHLNPDEVDSMVEAGRVTPDDLDHMNTDAAGEKFAEQRGKAYRDFVHENYTDAKGPLNGGSSDVLKNVTPAGDAARAEINAAKSGMAETPTTETVTKTPTVDTPTPEATSAEDAAAQQLKKIRPLQPDEIAELKQRPTDPALMEDYRTVKTAVDPFNYGQKPVTIKGTTPAPKLGEPRPGLAETPPPESGLPEGAEPMTDENTPDGTYQTPPAGAPFTKEWDAQLPNEYGSTPDPNATKAMSPSEQMAFYKAPTEVMPAPQPQPPQTSWWNNMMGTDDMLAAGGS